MAVQGFCTEASVPLSLGTYLSEIFDNKQTYQWNFSELKY